MPKKFFKKPTISFQERVYEVVRKIPKGRVMTYREVARLAGRPRAWRTVGNILNKSASWRTKIPCHRIIKSDGKIGGYKEGTKRKATLLKKEGVVIKNRRVAF
jgi:methylated-DNA-[protein]-cysteine S-methyltransferase